MIYLDKTPLTQNVSQLYKLSHNSFVLNKTFTSLQPIYIIQPPKIVPVLSKRRGLTLVFFLYSLSLQIFVISCLLSVSYTHLTLPTS